MKVDQQVDKCHVGVFIVKQQKFQLLLCLLVSVSF